MRARLARLAPEEIVLVPLLLLGLAALALQPGAVGRLIPVAPAAASPILLAPADGTSAALYSPGELAPLPLRIESMRARLVLTIPAFGGRRAAPHFTPSNAFSERILE